ncbi:hypothetical protein LCGC14_1914020 [marine sediment metagenome]|uniref:Uncharacterized protein n=1 Tax=marine sediment metagenome TaxID=412755 RepID=A0A0F9GG04_9ZZZZ
MTLLVQHPIFDTVMSREAKWLRDEVLGMCIKFGSTNTNQVELVNSIIDQYSPLVWERAILYAENKKVFNAICRYTSSAYHTKKNKPGVSKPDWEKGSLSGNRHKHVDWLEIAGFNFDIQWWERHIDFGRYGFILPTAFDHIRDEFTKMYALFSDWLIIDFSLTSLRNIFNITGKYSTEFIYKCMELVLDKSKRSVEYLLPIIEKEFTIARNELLERKELTSQSKQVLKSILDSVDKDREPVNWGPIDTNLKVDKENTKTFDKVKLS